MAQVPTYDGPQVRDQAIQPVFTGTPDVSSGLQAVARGMAQVGDAIDTTLKRQAETEANKIDNEITAGWLQWNADAQRNPNYRGEGVAQYEKDAAKWWEDARTKHAGNASPLARSLVGPALGRKRNSAFASISDYANRERERFADEQSEAAAQSAIEFGVDAGDTVGASQRVREIVAAKGARKGWTTEMVQADQQRLLGTLHLTQIERLAERDAEAAQRYYDQYKTELPASSQGRVETVIKGNADNQFAVNEAARLAGLPLSQQLAAAAEVADPERKKKLITEIKSNYALVEAEKAAAQADASDRAWQMFVTGQKIPESVLASMDGKDRYKLQEAQLARANRGATGASVKTNPVVYLDLRERIAAGERVDLRAHVEQIGTTELKELENLQKADQDDMLTNEQRIRVALTGMQIDIRRDPDTARKVMSEIDRRVRAASAAKGDRKLTPDEKQAVIDSVVKDKVYVPGFLRDTETPLALVPPEDMADAYVRVDGRNVLISSVPATDRAEIIRERQKRGLPVTETDIVTAYVRANKK